MRLYLYLCFWTIGTAAIAQDEITSKENVKIPARITSASGQLIRYINSFSDKADSIPADAVREFRYKDSVRVLVLPVTKRGQVDVLTSVEFQDAISNENYPVLLHGKTSRYDLRFTTPPNNRTAVALTPDTRVKLAPLVALLKGKPNLTFEITVHSDTVGKAAMNQLLTDRQAAALQTYLASAGLPMANFTISGKGESELINAQQPLNRRVDFKCTAVKGIAIHYAEPYIPPKRIEPVVQAPAPVQPAQEYTRIQSAMPKNQKPFSILVYGEGLYALKSLSADWVDPDTGPGILQGFGGGLLFTYYVKPRIGLTAQIGYSSWAVRRRYIDNNQSVAFTNDQILGRLVAQLGIRLYATRSVYIQPMAGGQQLTLTSQNSETHPNGVNKTVTKKFLPTVGAAIGYEISQNKLLIDLAAQYYFIPNKIFTGVTQPLQFIGLRVGLGYRSERK